jgi:hypothetical protein
MGAGRMMLYAATPVLLAMPAFAQSGLIAPSKQYETPLYSTRPSTVNKNYGLPSFGMPNAELPKQGTRAVPSSKGDTATLGSSGGQDRSGDDSGVGGQSGTGMPDGQSRDASTSDVPDFFSGSPDFALPKPTKRPGALSTDPAETPLFTTNDSSANATPTPSIFADPGASGKAGDDATTSSGDTPLFTTEDGTTNSDSSTSLSTK